MWPLGRRLARASAQPADVCAPQAMLFNTKTAKRTKALDLR
jgi:hypothetical protein